MVRLADLRRRPRTVARLARRRGGVRVVGERGQLLFTLCIPSGPIA